ncbi:hypothetical protein A3J78_00765 [Candidatus Beckwithbacteria bacterium RBG_13_35_6]|uniref:DUF5667 domain-containing protein n=1 Tax=Candidatus Beckwithbacteria bacterium RBG_13_35_6 TaxID=1797456 RepID=A0A1F5DI20_9BACT|nr:MAG: hypothetical protein A3J78_00765 [Candidatus Beckwithbacteria bacterium RBG_13_35_6]
MKKLITIITALTVLLLTPVLVSAQGVQQRDRVQDPSTHAAATSPQGYQVQSQNQTQTQNQGVETQLRLATQHMEQLMNMKMLGDEIGSQIRTLAQEQVQNQAQIQAQVEKLESRSGLMKKLFGPDYKAIKNLNQQMEQNQTMIQQLEMLANQVQNQGEQTQLRTAIQALVQQNTALQNRVQAEEKVGSAFGWLFKLIS